MALKYPAFASVQGSGAASASDKRKKPSAASDDNPSGNGKKPAAASDDNLSVKGKKRPRGAAPKDNHGDRCLWDDKKGRWYTLNRNSGYPFGP